MNYKWDLNDKKIWENSEVLKELEKRMIKTTFKLQKIIEAQMAGEITQKVENVKKQTEQASESLGELLNQAENLAEDEEEYKDEEELIITPEEHAMARESLINELRDMISQAIDKNNVKLAYQIERTIDELLFED